ncbi:MAG: hypothetical protein NT105_13890 [Verrucomicrobia bacterium]|nr:hypothetical protein [Verrucomicrobiota bacterium]
MRKLLPLFLVMVLAPMLAQAGHGSWVCFDQVKSERECIAYVHIESVEEINHSVVKLKLRPIARLAGKLDFNGKNLIEVQLPIGIYSQINLPPKPNSYAIALISDPTVPDVSRGQLPWRIYSDRVFFMPNFKGLVPVVGDPTPIMEKVLEAIKLLRDAKVAGRAIQPVITEIEQSFKSLNIPKE